MSLSEFNAAHLQQPVETSCGRFLLLTRSILISTHKHMHAKIPTKNSRKPVERNEVSPEKVECHNAASDAGGEGGGEGRRESYCSMIDVRVTQVDKKKL